MGIFSTKRKHFVDTSVVRVIEDDQVPNAVEAALVESLFTEDTTIVEAIKNQALNGAHRNFGKMYKYAKSGAYFYGLPNATLISSDSARPLIVPAIQADIGQTGVVLDYYFFRPLNNIHAGWKHLYDNMSYVKSTNEIGTLTSSVGFDCYLLKMVAVHETLAGQEIEQDAIGTWEASSTAGLTQNRPAWTNIDATASLTAQHEYRVGTTETESVEIHYTYDDAAGTSQTAFVVLNLSAYDTDQEYHQAKYHYTVGAVTYTGYWTYDHLTGTHTALNAVYEGNYVAPGTYFPIAVFRSEDANRATTALQNTQAYITTEKLLEFIGMDFREVADSMHADPDIGDIDQAVLMMAVPITSTNQAELRYLFDYFSDIHDSLPVDATDGNSTESPDLQSSDHGLSGGPNKSWAIDIQDADFRLTLSFQGIKKRLITGSFGAVGDYQNYQQTFDAYNIPFRDPATGAPSHQANIASRPQRIFRHQINEFVYEEITIDSPQIRYHIYKNKGAEAGAHDGRCLIPIDYNVANALPFLVREELYFRSVHFVFNSHVVQTIKWWQRGAFRIVLLIVAVVLAYFGSDLGFRLYMAVGLAAKAVVLLKFIILLILEMQIIGFVFKEIAKAIGAENALWLAVIAAVVGGVKVLKSGGFVAGSTAAKFLFVANGLARGSAQAFGLMIEDLMDDYKEWELLRDEMEEELQRGEDLLGVNLNMNPFVFIGATPLFVPGETSEDYFDRTIHSGNVGVKTLNIVQNYVAVSLTLPTINETIEEV